MAYHPSVNGIRLGSLVVLKDVPVGAGQNETSRDWNGEQGQLVDYDAGTGKCGVSMLSSGAYLNVEPSSISVASSATGGQAGDACSFDLVLGPRSRRDAAAEEIATCLLEKGFCVIRTVQSASDVAECLSSLKELDSNGRFGRMCEEVEEGYLGTDGTAKIMWVDPDSSDLSLPLVKQSDDTLSGLAQMLSPLSEDALGVALTERTPTMVCMAIRDDEQDLYERPEAEDGVLREYLSTWRRGRVRLVHFLGPDAGTVTLARRTGPRAPDPEASGADEERLISAVANTILLVRQDMYTYTYAPEGRNAEALWMQSFLLKQPCFFKTVSTAGDPDALVAEEEHDGPPPPDQELVGVMSMGLLASGNMNDYGQMCNALTAGTDGFVEFPLARFDYHPYYSPDPDAEYGWTFVKHMSFMDGADMFDNKIFEISNAEAGAMDPQQRAAMEVGLMCLHGVGITKKVANTKAHHASVSVGCDKSEYIQMNDVPKSVAANNQLAINSNRLGYVFNLKGGNYVCDTACSSSLVAMHLGKGLLMERRWDPLDFHLALGVNYNLTLIGFIHCCGSHMLSPGGRCFTFNATANGYARGDGNSGMLLKCIGETINDDAICLLRGSQVGQDGRSASMAAPNGPAQEKCVVGAMREARMTPPESTAWECHGTGTSLGDPIEVGAVKKVQTRMARSEPLMLGTSKANIGHCEGGAAMLAMMKCIIQVTRGVCVPTLHVKTLNPHLDHAKFDATYDTDPLPYHYKSGHCQVSSFGVGGTNGHAIFWGSSAAPRGVEDTEALFQRRVNAMNPVLSAVGSNPDDWELQGPEADILPGQRYRVIVSKGSDEIRWELMDEEEDEQAAFYSVTGNFNGWSDDRMYNGDVEGVWWQELEVPSSGRLEFRFLVEDDKDRALAPDRPECTRRTARIVGPQRDVQEFWLVRGEPGSCVRVELLAKGRHQPTVTWFDVGR